MTKPTTVYSDQIFLRINTKDNSSIIMSARRDMLNVEGFAKRRKEGLVQSLKDGREIDSSLLLAYSKTRSLLYKVREEALLNRYDEKSIFRFWTLNNFCKDSAPILPGQENQIILTSINGQHYRSFDSINEMYSEFIPLEEIINNGTFIGRKQICGDEPFEIYVLYSYKIGDVDLLISCFRYDDNKHIITAGLGRGNSEIALTGPRKKSLKGIGNIKDISNIKRLIYKMKSDYERQID